jgi:hypothetical protein
MARHDSVGPSCPVIHLLIARFRESVFSDDVFSLFDVNSSCGCQVPGLHEFIAINSPTTINLSLNLFGRAAQRERQFLATRFESGVPDVL